MLTKFKANRVVRNVQNVELFDKKRGFKNYTNFDKCWRYFARHFCTWNNVNHGKLLILRLLSFCVQKVMVVRRVTRFKVAPNMADPTSIKHSVGLSSLNPRLHAFYRLSQRELDFQAPACTYRCFWQGVTMGVRKCITAFSKTIQSLFRNSFVPKVIIHPTSKVHYQWGHQKKKCVCVWGGVCVWGYLGDTTRWGGRKNLKMLKMVQFWSFLLLTRGVGGCGQSLW